MGRRRKKGRPVNGWIVLDKDYDFGSTDAVSKLKWLLKAQKAGHAGTLDPLATGILPIAFGEATKTVPYVTESRKTYRFTARWGISTTTDDAEGEELATSQIRPDREQILSRLPAFTGAIKQTPPKFSAIKIDGARAYDLARDGEDVSPAARTIQVHRLELINTPDADHASFEAVTGKGAYVRALVRDLAKALGTEGHVSELRRTAVGPFTEANAVKLSMLEQLETPEERDEELLPVEAALAHLPQADIGESEAGRLRCGQPAVLSPATARGIRAGESGLVASVLALRNGGPVAICELDGLKLHPLRVFNLANPE
ncbi:MAG: tRNA pseudouridine(55) synthase TruB [Alphaproteobacteria bacterium]|nr:tRNA pseudouridine(55) synthase TruB [Alphaproteobacteria bacterium]